jgi:hypothetical protein
VTINGVVVPAGTYIDAAYIKNLTALVARLGDAWITNAMVQSLAADKIVTGTLSVGNYIQSSNYVTGVSGWLIHGNGSGEVSSWTVRGTIYASAGAIGGMLINAADVRSSNFVADTTGYKFDNTTGSIEVNNLRVRGTVDLKSGTSGQRREMTASYDHYYDAANTLRIEIGLL